jgi:TPP-dependent pyruvate/acetoin dehydrogenase alpha subunit
MTTAEVTAQVSDSTRVQWLRRMLEVRLFEEKVQELFMQGRVQGTTHLCQGQEAVSVGAISAMEPQDYLTITYRGHGHALARGMPMDAAFGEMMGLSSGCCGGVGGSMHLTDFSRNLIGAFAIVGAGFPVAVGAAMSARLRGTDAVAVTFCGDGATNIGTFHESLNMASAWKAPIVFIVENNLYGEYSPVRVTTPVDDLADRAKAHGMPGIVVDGQDVAAVHATALAAIARARAGNGPSLIEAKTYRFKGHSRTDPGTYRPRAEIEHWTARDPIRLLGDALALEGILSVEDQRALTQEVQAEVDLSADRAAQAPAPTLEEIKSYVYAT